MNDVLDDGLIPERRYRFWKDGILPKLAFLAAGVPKNSFGSVDVTDRCNLRCEHCYFFADGDLSNEATEEDLIRAVEAQISFRGKKVWNCTWVGGEPLLRPRIIERLRHHFKFNIVVTNGSLPLPDWKGVTFYVSLDGTEEIHDKIRGKGSYQRLKKNVTDPKNIGKTIRLACCINRMNFSCIEQMLEEWHPCPTVKEMVFDFFTPVDGLSDSLWLSFEERDRVVNRLVELKRKKYGRFIAAGETTYDLMRSKNKDKAVGENCIFMQKGFALDAAGKLKSKCMLGPKADCARCGCIVPFYLKSRERRYIIKELI